MLKCKQLKFSGNKTMLFEDLDQLIASKEFQNYQSDKLGDLWISDPDRAERIYDYAEHGCNGSTHKEVIEDWRDFIKDVYSHNCSIENEDFKEKNLEAIEQEITDCEEWHNENGSLFEVIG